MNELQERFNQLNMLKTHSTDYTKHKNFIKENIVYIWDDLADLKIIRDSNWSATTKNAPTLVKKYCNYISEYGGWEWWLADIILEYMKIKWIDVESLFFN